MSLLPIHSIRLRLAATLFPGFLLLLGLASVLVYFVVARILNDDFNARLFAKAQAALASISQKGTSLDVDWTELPQELNLRKHPQDAIQILDGNGQIFFKDSSLVASPRIATVKGVYQDAVSPQLGPVRVFTLSFLPRVEEEDMAETPSRLIKNCVLAVATSRQSLDHSLHKLTVILGLMTGLTSLFSLALVWMAVRQGLRPLDRLGAAMARVDAESLGQQIPLDDVPSELSPIAEKLNDLLGRLDVSFARERRFTADVSHELRTPVAELKTLSEVMLQEPNRSAEVTQAFEDTHAIALQMEALVTVLLEMVRQEDGRTTLPLTEVDLQLEIQSVWKRYGKKADSKELRLNAPRAAEKILLRTEPRTLSMVLGNLIDNAIEYSPSGSVIGIEFQEDKEFSCLVISNPNQNLAPSDLPHLFERFWRKDKARGASTHFGLGLSLTRSLCNRLGIYLSVSMDRENVIHFKLHFLPSTIVRNL